MDIQSKTINGIPVTTRISSSFLNEQKEYSIEVRKSRTDAEPNWIDEIQKYTFTNLTDFVSGRFVVDFKAESLIRTIRKTDEVVLKEKPQALAVPMNFKVDDSIRVEKDLGMGMQEYGRYTLFSIVSETVGVRLPEHVLNGIMDYISRFPVLFDEINPIYVDRTDWKSNQYVEGFADDYSSIQPVIAKVISVTPETIQVTQEVVEVIDGVETVTTPYSESPQGNGEININVSDFNGSLTYSINEGEPIATNENILISNLSQGDYEVRISSSEGVLLTLQVNVSSTQIEV